MKLKKYIYFIFIVFILLNTTSCGKKSLNITYKNGYPDLKGKHLVVYVASRDEVGKSLLELFKEKTGCTYEYMRMPTEKGVERVRLEKKYPKADIFMGGSCDAHEMMKEEKLSERYISENYSEIEDQYKDKKGYWTGIEIEPLSIAINKDRWEKEFSSKGIKIPKNYEDLLNPIYKGEIVMPDPKTSGTAYTMIASLMQILGKNKALRLLKGIKSNVGKFTINGYTPAQKVGTGEYLIGINFLGDQLLVKKSGFNIISNIPNNAGWNIDSVSKIKNAPNGDIGNLFIDFCTSKEVGNTLKKISMGMPTRSDIKIKENMDFYKLNIYKEYDFTEAGNKRENLMKIWDNLN